MKTKLLLRKRSGIRKFFQELGVEDVFKTGIELSSAKFKFGEAKVKVDRVRKKGDWTYKAESGMRTVEGYATTEDVDWVQDKVTKEAMEYAKDHLLNTGTNTVFYNHDTDRPVGKVLSAFVDTIGLYIKVMVSKAKDVQDLWTKVKEGVIKNFSIRFLPKLIEVEKDDKGDIVSWNIKKMELLEVSLVGLPMNKFANVLRVTGKSYKSTKGVSVMKNKKQITKKAPAVADGAAENLEKKIGKIVSAQLKGVMEKLDALVSKKAGEKEEKVTKKVSKKSAEKEEKPKKHSGVLAKRVRELEKKMKLRSGRKGVAETDEGDGDEETDAVPKKVLKDVDDQATCVFVLKAMDDTTIYDKLSTGEKDKVKTIYFQMLKDAKKI